MKKALTWLLIVALTAAVAVGGTMAYLTDTDEDTNVMTLGNVKIDQLEYERVDVESKDDDAIVQEFHDNKPMYPAVIQDGFAWTTGDANVDWSQIGKDGYSSGIWDPEKINNEQDKMVFVKNKGASDAYVRSIFAFEANGYTLDQFNELFHLNINETDWTWEWVETPVSIPNEDGSVTTNYIVATATYNKVLKPGEFTEISLSQIALDPAATNADIAGFGDTYQILVKTQAVQTEGFENAQEALNKGFGEVTTGNLPFENDSPIRGIDLRTALHYLDGDTAGTKITANVTNVIFAKNSEYPDIVNGYEGTLVDVEQDVNVYAYYVPNGSNYDVYFLADGTIYSPKDSSELFRNMTALKKVDTGNFAVSRTENMLRMFQSCSSLVEMDTGSWDTSKVTTMARMFQSCTVLPYLDVADWDVSNVTDMYCTFGGSETLNDLDVSKWDVSKATNMAYMFWHCYSLENLEVGNWDVGNVTTFEDMFAGRHNMGNMKVVPDVENWDMSSAVSIRDMFYGCARIEELDLSKWDVSNVQDMRHTFCDCFSLKTVNFSGWDTSSLVNMDGTFNDCISLVDLDVSEFDTQNVQTMAQLFEGCASLVTVVGLDKWDTSNVWEMEEMFYTNGRGSSLEYVDLSSFNTNKMKETMRMFGGCSNLKTIYVGDGWDMSNVTDSSGMFDGCGSLVGGNGTTHDGSKTDKTYACVDTDETPGYLTYKNANG